MRGKLAFFRERLLGSRDDSEADTNGDDTGCALFECPACGTVLIEASVDKCPQCSTAELVEV